MTFFNTTAIVVASSFVGVILFMCAILYYFGRKSMRGIDTEISNYGELLAKASLKQQEIEAAQEWMEEQREELLSLKDEREEQERLRSSLAQLHDDRIREEAILRDLREQSAEAQHLIDQQTELSAKIDQAKTELEQLGRQRQPLQEEVDHLLRQLEQFNELQSQYEREKIKYEELLQAKHSAERALGDVNDKLEQLENQRRPLQEEIAFLQNECGKFSLQQAQFEREKIKHDEVQQARLSAENVLNATNDKLEQLKQQLQPLQEEVEDLQRKREDLCAQQTAFEREKITYDELKQAKQAVERTLDETKEKLEQLKLQSRPLQEEIENLQRKRDELRSQLVAYEAEKIKHDELTQAKLATENALSEEKAKLESARQEMQTLRPEVENLKKKAEEAQQECSSFQKRKSELEIDIQALSARETALNALIEKNKKELNSLAVGGGSEDDGKRNEAAYEDLFLIEPGALKQHDLATPYGSMREQHMLSQFQQYLRGRNLYFSDRVINAFHTALKCQNINPLTVLAGVSGTGKTLLPVNYAEFFGMHTLVIPVQPRWDSPQDLFGFYNYLEKKYKATDLSRCLVRMDPFNYKDKNYGWAHERMLLVLLDEMNLARTEYYFSEFLSKLELRRQINPSDLSKENVRQKAEIALDGKLKLWVPQNVLFVGTMNEDESTQTLSDKVLDRSNVLRFGRPAEVVDRGNSKTLPSATEFLSFKNWESWQKQEIKPNASYYSDCKSWIAKLNDGLEKIGRPFGYRVSDAMLLYAANYPTPDYNLALADQVEQKILPKLRGIDIQDSASVECLNDVEAVLSALGDRELEEAFRNARQESSRLGLFTWRGVSRS